ncbi:MAG: response regulator, partial [Rubrivivax sp.]
KPQGHGTGLGLSMVYGFVRQSGGQVIIHSDLGKGTCVQLYLPRHQISIPASGQDIAQLQRVAAVQPGRLVMVVEDQPAMRTVISEVLEELGHSVRLFDTGTAALAALQNGLQSDLLITDIGLPGGLDGYKLAAAYQQLTPHTPVLFITRPAETAWQLTAERFADTAQTF